MEEFRQRDNILPRVIMYVFQRVCVCVRQCVCVCDYFQPRWAVCCYFQRG